MALPANADVPFILSRIRPSAEWGWKGGAKNDIAQLRWRDLVQLEPVEADYLAEQVVIDAEDATKAATRTAQRGRSDTLVGIDPNLFNQNEIKNAVEELLVRAGALNPETGDVLPIDEWPEL